MAKISNLLWIILFFVAHLNAIQNQSWIRINQLGYLPNSVKVAVLVSKSDIEINEFEIVDASTNEVEIVLNKIDAKK